MGLGCRASARIVRALWNKCIIEAAPPPSIKWKGGRRRVAGLGTKRRRIAFPCVVPLSSSSHPCACAAGHPNYGLLGFSAALAP